MTDMITLGGRSFELRPLKLGQLRAVVDALDRMNGKSGGSLIEAAAQIVAAGLAPAHAEIDAATLLDLEATIEELNAAVAAVLRVAGLQPPGEARSPDGRMADPGTASAAAMPESSSVPSTAPSPAAAATPTQSSTP